MRHQTTAGASNGTGQTIEVKIRNVYGTEKIYPVCDKARAFAAIAGQLTLTYNTINGIKALGYTITVIQDVKSL